MKNSNFTENFNFFLQFLKKHQLFFSAPIPILPKRKTHKTQMIKINPLLLILLILLILFPPSALTKEGPDQKPLFPITLDHDFPEPEKCFQEVKKLIMKNHYTSRVSEADLYWAAIKGMLRHVSPPETPALATIWTPEEYEKIENLLKGVNVSIGIKSSFNINDGSLTITRVLEGSPAESILQPYDHILRINGDHCKVRESAKSMLICRESRVLISRLRLSEI